MTELTKKLRSTALVVVMAGTVVSFAPAVPASAGGGCHDPMSVKASGVKVDAKGLCFYPTILYVKPGATVTWTNRDATEHSVTGLGASWGSGYDTIAQGESVSADFPVEGIYPYTCIVHPGMVGAVVAGSPTATSSNEAAAAPIPAANASPAAPAADGAPARASVPRSSGFPWLWLVIAGVLLGGSAFVVVQRLKVRRLRQVA